MGRKQHTSQEALESLPLPTPATPVARVIDNRGGGNYDVLIASNSDPAATETLIVSLPAKFRKLIWVKKGNFVIIQLADETSAGGKVGGEILNVLFPDQIKHIKSKGLWPEQFATSLSATATPPAETDKGSADAESDSDNDDDLFVNSNRRVQSSDEEESEEEEDGATPPCGCGSGQHR
ncbi:hypothetical protein BDZ88DRAFT_405734 [Geranomyces variabilis]|nr:hypothetical protein BDZ88DRAFT_405734 [Geranomyces variabilis]KAJ3135481.1 putative RNA-binding protein eif1ad [Geranomyces variabilis]